MSTEEPSTQPSIDTGGLDAFERCVVEVACRERGNASWYAFRHVSAQEPGRHLIEALEDLERRGYLTQELSADDIQRWSVSPVASAWLDGEIPEGPLTTPALAAVTAAMVRGLVDGIEAVREHAPDLGDATFDGVLRQVAAVDFRCASSVIAIGVGRPTWVALIRDLVRDPRPVVRAACFDIWLPVALARPGNVVDHLGVDEVDGMLRVGLADPVDKVREVAAALACGAERGAVLAVELARLADDPNEQVRYWVGRALAATTAT